MLVGVYAPAPYAETASAPRAIFVLLSFVFVLTFAAQTKCESADVPVQSTPMWKALIIIILLGVGVAAAWVTAGSADGPVIEITGPATIGQTGEIDVAVRTP